MGFSFFFVIWDGSCVIFLTMVEGIFEMAQILAAARMWSSRPDGVYEKTHDSPEVTSLQRGTRLVIELWINTYSSKGLEGRI